MQKIGLSMATAAAMILVSSTTVRAQLPPRQNAQMSQRAWDACNSAASRYGYRVIRRNQESVNGSQYSVPMHVQHGTTETDVTCSYDGNRGVAVVPQWDDRNNRVYSERDRDNDNGDERNSDERHHRRGNRYNNNGLSNAQLQAQQECQTAVNGRPGFRVGQLGVPVAHGARQWDVPLTVSRDGRQEQSVTCRYNTANGKVTLR